MKTKLLLLPEEMRNALVQFLMTMPMSQVEQPVAHLRSLQEFDPDLNKNDETQDAVEGE